MVPALTHCLFNLLGYHANACKNHGSTCINRTTANEWLADWLRYGRDCGPRRRTSHQCHFILTVTAMRGCMHGWMSCTTPCTYIVGGGIAIKGRNTGYEIRAPCVMEMWITGYSAMENAIHSTWKSKGQLSHVLQTAFPTAP